MDLRGKCLLRSNIIFMGRGEKNTGMVNVGVSHQVAQQVGMDRNGAGLCAVAWLQDVFG